MAFGRRIYLCRNYEKFTAANSIKMKGPYWHYILRAYVRLCLKLYFRKWQIQGLQNIPYDRPVLFVCNHQNAFLDALLVLSPLKRIPWFLARADVFNKAWLSKTLRALHIMPVYRIRDGFNSIKNNDITFNQSAEILLQNQGLLIFVEGDHGERWMLRPLKKGFARIAFETEISAVWKSNLCIIPVGIQYEKREEMRSRVLVSYGKAIDVAQFQTQYESQPNNALNALVTEVSKSMQQLLVHITPLEKYDAIHYQLMKRRSWHTDLVEQLKADQHLVANIKSVEIPDPEIISLKKSKTWKWVNPILVYGLINNLITYLIQRLLIKKVKDPQFKPSLNFLAAMFILPLSVLLQSGIVQYVFSNWLITIVYALSIPICGILAYQFYKK
jgi:1-acyl-sn-glycerol-3-phosphate acyltransferase